MKPSLKKKSWLTSMLLFLAILYSTNQAFAPGGFLQTFDLRPELAAITAPTLILAGQHDWICPPEFSQEIHRLMPHSQLQVFENSSHSLRVDEPERMLRTIRAFVSG
jgi:proline iminopeptidase